MKKINLFLYTNYETRASDSGGRSGAGYGTVFGRRHFLIYFIEDNECP